MTDVPADARRLGDMIKADGGEVLGMYRDPLGGHSVVVAALPLDRVEPTPYQRDRSEARVKKLANAMERVARFLDPLIAVRKDGRYWTPNGNHRLGAMALMGMKSITALVVPEEDVAHQILALNTEKAHNPKERSLEVIRMYRGLVGVRGDDEEAAFAAIFEEPHFITFGAAYEKRPRFSAGAYSSIVKRLESFQDDTLAEGLPLREASAESTAFPPVGVIVWHTLYEGNGDKFPEVMASARARAGNALDFVGQRLGDRPYLLGADFSAADIMMGFTLFAARVLGVLDERHAVLTRYLARLEERPAFRIAAEL
jgi:hypothetical protein